MSCAALGGRLSTEPCPAFVTLSLPGLIYELIPIATLIGSLYALSTLARHSEITVLRASGLATKDLLMTLFRVAGLLALLTLFVGEGLVPLPREPLRNCGREP